MSKKKVLLVSRDHPPFMQGGMGICSGYLEKLLPQHDIELTIIGGNPHIRRHYKEQRQGVTVYWVPLWGRTFLTKIPCFAFFAGRLMRRIQSEFDLIYSLSTPFLYKPSVPLLVHFQGTRYGEYLGCKEIHRNWYALLNKCYVPFERSLLLDARALIILSESMLKELQGIAEIKKEYTVIPNGVDTSLFKPIGIRRFEPGLKNILYVGRLDARKGIETLLKACSSVSARTKITLTVVGQGIEEARLKLLARQLNIPVNFPGKISNERLPQVYNNADIAVVPSVYEPFGLVALEAMACGTPTIVSSGCLDVGMPRFEKRNPDSLAGLLLEYMSSEEKLHALSEKALLISKEYDWGKIVTKISRFIHHCAHA